MKEKLIKVLLAMGVSQANAELIANPEGDASKIDETVLISEFKANQLALHENDKTIIDKIDIAATGRLRDNFEKKIKAAFALSSEETKDKKIDDIIKLAVDKSSSNANKTVEQLQNELIEKTKAIKELKEIEIPNIRKEVDSHKKQFNVNDKLTKLVSGFELRNPLEDVMASVQHHLGNSYDVDLDDKGEIVVKVKGTDLLPKNADGTKFLTPKEIIQAKLETAQFLKQSNADDTAAAKAAAEALRTKNPLGGKEEVDKTRFPGYDAALKNLEALKVKQ